MKPSRRALTGVLLSGAGVLLWLGWGGIERGKTAGEEAPAERFESREGKGSRASVRRETGENEPKFRELLEKRRNDPEALMALALIGPSEKAKERLREMSGSSPEAAAACFLLGIGKAHSAELAETIGAEEAYRGLAALLRVQVLSEEGKGDEASEAFLLLLEDARPVMPFAEAEGTFRELGKELGRPDKRGREKFRELFRDAEGHLLEVYADAGRRSLEAEAPEERTGLRDLMLRTAGGKFAVSRPETSLQTRISWCAAMGLLLRPMPGDGLNPAHERWYRQVEDSKREMEELARRFREAEAAADAGWLRDYEAAREGMGELEAMRKVLGRAEAAPESAGGDGR